MVSIHAPTRGATRDCTKLFNDFSVSIHAPTRGATCSCPLSTALCSCFNPRTHTGCDVPRLKNISSISKFQSTHPHGVRLIGRYRRSKRLEVSIHAPTRGATSVTGDHSDTHAFQSTHPHGVRLSTSNILLTFIYSFNPRTHTGCDIIRRGSSKRFEVSIHAPTRGATIFHIDL